MYLIVNLEQWSIDYLLFVICYGLLIIDYWLGIEFVFVLQIIDKIV